MEDIWNEVLDELAVPKEIASKWWDKILVQYSDRKRIYHNMECLAQKFKIYEDMIKDNISERSAFVIAIFFQHFEYDTNVYGGCIDKNVNHVKEFFKEAGIEHEGLISSVVGLLGAGREGGGGGAGEGASAYFQDLELAPLGLPADEYIQYIADVEMEYAQQPVHLYRSLRLKILQTLLLIPKIFATDTFRIRFEEIARDNIQSEIDQMLM